MAVAPSRGAALWVVGGLGVLALLLAFLAVKPGAAPPVAATPPAPAPVVTATAEPVRDEARALPAAAEPVPVPARRTVIVEAPAVASAAPAPAPPTRDEMRAALRRVSIKVYATSWCPVCQKARAWLSANQIPYTEYDVDHNPAARREQLTLNPRGSVPTIDVDGQVLIGFGERNMGDAIQHAVDRRLAAR